MPADPTVLPAALRAHLEVTYTLERPLGVGGMGVVWLARDRMLDRLVAIKVMRAEVALDAESSSRFLLEARVAARLQHPAVVGLLSMGEVEGARYFVMPYVHGETLAARLARGPLPEGEARTIFADIADALAHLHMQGVVHRDVKPANILIDRQTRLAKLADFGIAKAGAATRLTATGMLVGTPAYLAPEQFLGDGAPIDGRADLYALGVVAYEMVAGVPPFGGATPHELMARQAASAPPSLAARVPGLSAAYESAVLRCLAKERDARWGTGAELAKALRVSDDGDPDPPELRPVRHALAHGLVISSWILAWGALPLSVLFPQGGIEIGAHLGTLLVCTATPLLMALGRVRTTIQQHAELRIRWRDALRVAMRVPPWWPIWWPRRWLSPADRRRDLPSPVRRVLSSWGLAIGSFAGLLEYGGLILSVVAVTGLGFPRQPGGLRAFLDLTYWAGMVGTFGGGIALAWSLRRARNILGGAGSAKTMALLGTSRGHEFWQFPWVRALLPDAADRDSMVPKTFDHLLADVSELQDRLVAAGWPLEDISSLIAEARAARADWEREAALLAADADPAEGERLRSRLDALEGAGSRSAEQAELRELLRRQLALHDRQWLRVEEVNARYERLRAGLELMWRQLRALRADDARRLTSSELTGRVRELGADIHRLRQAAAETTPMAPGS